MQVTVAEGKVAVRGRATDTIALLEADQQLRVRQGIPGQVTRVNAEDVSAWKDSHLVFESTPLAEVIGTLQRYHRQPITLIDPSIARLPVSGVFDSDHVERLLALLPGILPVNVATAADGAVLIKSRDTKK
ncbi:fec operon regulator FecR [compost metagenome]